MVVRNIREKLRVVQDRHKHWANAKRRHLEFQPGDHVFLRISLNRGVIRFGKRGKLGPRFIGPFDILERVGEVAYRLHCHLHWKAFTTSFMSRSSVDMSMIPTTY